MAGNRRGGGSFTHPKEKVDEARSLADPGPFGPRFGRLRYRQQRR
jgi:hypothetical protein